MLLERRTPDRGLECSQHDGDVKLELAAQILRSRSVIRIRVYGTSMLPYIWPGDVLAIENCQPCDIRLGDIIRFMQSGRFLIHRVVTVANDSGSISWITRGDSLSCEDLPVSQTHFLGRVTAIERNGRSFAPARQISTVAHWVGRTLQSFGPLQGLVFRVRLLLRRSGWSELVRAYR